MHTFFFHNPADFDEVVEFTNVEARQYGLDMRILHGGFREGLESLLRETNVKGIILGTRKCVVIGFKAGPWLGHWLPSFVHVRTV